jgi:hypothetical protein
MESVGTNPLPRKGSRTSGIGRLLAVSTVATPDGGAAAGQFRSRRRMTAQDLRV